MIFIRKNERSGDQLYLELLIKYTELDKYNDIKVVKLTPEHGQLLNCEVLPKMLTKDNRSLLSLQEISIELLTEVNFDISLVGNSIEARSNCLRFFELCNSLPSFEELCEVLQKELNGVTFLNGEPNLHISDLYVFCHLLEFLVNASTEVKAQFYNVYRWFNYIQNLNGIQENITEMKYRQMDEITVDDLSLTAGAKKKGKKPDDPTRRPDHGEKAKQEATQGTTQNKKPQQGKQEHKKTVETAKTEKTPTPDSAPVEK
jgi:hypothetical protein